jgi:hypothetical protein
MLIRRKWPFGKVNRYSEPPGAAVPADPVLGTHGSLSRPLLWRTPACSLETVEHPQRRRRKHHRL